MPNNFCQRLGLTTPIVLAPMAGGPGTPELAAAVSNAGGLGFLGINYLAPHQIEEAINRTRRLTQKMFGVNLFAPEASRPLSGDIDSAKAFLSPFHTHLGIALPELPEHAGENFDQQLDIVLSLRVPVVSFTMGIPRVEKLKATGTYLIGTATTVEEAQLIERAGFDAVVAQGSEAGAHRGTFLVKEESALIGTMALTPQIVDAVSIPVLASGGIMDGRGIVAALALGAQAVQMGTAFLCCDEAGTGTAYRQALLGAREHQTTLTRAFSGRLARGVRNEYIEGMEAAGVEPLPFPWQNALTRSMRQAARVAERASLQSLWAGQGLRMLRSEPAGEVMARLKNEIAACRERMLTTDLPP